jgi:hypothetical protein
VAAQQVLLQGGQFFLLRHHPKVVPLSVVSRNGRPYQDSAGDSSFLLAITCQGAGEHPLQAGPPREHPLHPAGTCWTIRVQNLRISWPEFCYFQQGHPLLKKPICAEKLRLLDEHVFAKSELYGAATNLRLASGADLPNALAASEAAREKCEKAWRALLNHKDLHGC